MSAKKKKKIGFFRLVIKVFTVLFAIAVLSIPVILGTFIYFNSPPKNTHFIDFSDIGGITQGTGGVYFEVRQGESARSVGRRLERAGLIRHRYFWNFMNRFENEHIKIGTYKIEEGQSQLAIHRLLISGRQVLHRVTIPEGVTLRRTARILEEAGITTYNEFLEAARNPDIINFFNVPNASMEGYLFPDTYLFPAPFPAEQVVRAMADNFFRRISEIYPNVHNLTPQELNDRVIMASIVEREHRLPEEAPIMAGVFFNRLRIGRALQSCATVEYIITEILGLPHPSVILYRDLEIVNPFNTYMFRGLPPGPISAPGATALNAAFFPAQTDFLYFRLIDAQTGRHHFSRTFNEHLRAGQLFRGH